MPYFSRQPILKMLLSCVKNGLMAVMLLAIFVGPVDAVEDEDFQQVVADFLQACRDNPRLSNTQRERVFQIIASIGQDATIRDAAITEALRSLYPDFSATLTILGNEETNRAAVQLIKLVKADDKFLAAESAYFLARAFIAEDRYEEALPILQQLTTKWSKNTLRSSEALYLRGLSEAQLLRRLESILTLQSYLKQNPSASARVRENVQQQLQFLRLIQEGAITDVHAQMEYSQRRLSLEDSGKQTQQTQEDIVEMLTKLIVLAEKKESSEGEGSGDKPGGKGKGGGQGGGGGGKGQSSGQLGSGANTEKDHFPSRNRRIQRSNRMSWEALQEKQRDTQAFTALKNNFPARYRKLIQQYYRSFQEEENE